MTIAGPTSLNGTNNAQPFDYLNSFLDKSASRAGMVEVGGKFMTQNEALLYEQALGVSRYGDKPESDEKKEEEKKERLQTEAAMETFFEFNGSRYDWKTVMASTSAASFQMEAYLNRQPQTVDPSQMLYVDANGQRVPAGTPGAKQVSTLEEKAALEARDKGCTIYKAAEEVTKDANGNIIPSKDALANLAIADSKERLEGLNADLASGKRTMDSLSNDDKAFLAKTTDDIQKNGELTATKQDGPGVLGILQREQAQAEMVSDYQKRNGIEPKGLNPFAAPTPPQSM